MCCYVVVTLRSLMWSLLSIFVFLIELAAMISAHWMISSPVVQSTKNNSNVLFPQQKETVVRTTGLFFRCEETGPIIFLSVSKNCRVYAHSISEIASPFWVATCIFLAIGLLLLFVVAMFSVLALCRRSIGKKSIFSISGILQAIAGLFLIFALILFPAGWGSENVQRECGGTSSAFDPGTCEIGWAYYALVAGTLLTFFCAVFSHQAAVATDSETVENDIIDGKNPVCAL